MTTILLTLLSLLLAEAAYANEELTASISEAADSLRLRTSSSHNSTVYGKINRQTFSSTRGLLQSTQATSSDDCALSEEFLDGLLEATSRTWRIDNAALEALENDLESLVRCSAAGDTLSFDVSSVIQPTRPVTVKWNLTLTAATEAAAFADGIYPEAARKATFHCPTSSQGVFKIQSQDVLLANLVFEDCSLDGDVDGMGGIIEVEPCSEGDSGGTIRLHHVSFIQNELDNSAALAVQTPSCSTLEVVDVQLSRNRCSGICGLRLSAQNTLRDLRISRNAATGGRSSVLTYAPPGSVTTVEELTASRNNATVLHVDGGELQIQDSSLRENQAQTVPSNPDTQTFSAGLQLTDAVATIRRCDFEANVALNGSALQATRSNTTLRGCRFLRNQAEDSGGGVHLQDCLVTRIRNCSFESGAAFSGSGGGLSSLGVAQLVLEGCTFESNRAFNGSGISVIGGSAEIEDCQFERNSAGNRGGGGFFADVALLCDRCIFINNSATKMGGAVRIESSSVANFSALNCSANGPSLDGGCLSVNDTFLDVSMSTIQANEASFDGGGIHVTESDRVQIISTSFMGNSGGNGAALYLVAVAQAEVDQTLFVNNQANQAALHVGSSSVFVNNSRFEGNEASGTGGGVQCSGLTSTLNVTETLFLRNAASSRGGAVVVSSGCRAGFVNTTWRSNRSANGSGAGAAVSGASGHFEDVIFENNTAPFGGAIVADGSQLDVLHGSFLNNSASSNGGAISVQETDGTILDSSFANNTAAEYGGALHFTGGGNFTVDGTRVISNSAGQSGGCFSAISPGSLNFTNSICEQSTAEQSGGSIYAAEINLSLLNATIMDSRSEKVGGCLRSFSETIIQATNVLFSRCEVPHDGGAIAISGTTFSSANMTVERSKAEVGGAMIIQEDSFVTLRNSTLSDNAVEEEGGAIYISNSTLSAQYFNVTRNSAVESGGGIYAYESSKIYLHETRFDTNRAEDGAGIYLKNATLQLSYSAWHNNSALSSGGDIHSVESEELLVDHCSMSASSATRGGSIYLSDARGVQLRESSFTNLTATTVGGAVAAVEGSIIQMEGVSAANNKAELGGFLFLSGSGLWAKELDISGSRASRDGGGLFANASSSVICSSCVFEDNFAFEKGGAVALESTSMQLLAFQFDNSRFTSNSAEVGGGLHFVTVERGATCTQPNAECTFIALRGVVFSENRATSAGGAVLSSDLNSIRVRCRAVSSNSLEYLTKPQFESLPVLNSLSEVCSSWERNKAGLYGHTLASYARRVKKSIVYADNRTDIVEGTLYRIRNHPSGTQLPSLVLETVDALDQGPASVTGNAAVEATMYSPDQLFTGSVQLRLQDGRGNITGVSGYRTPGLYDVFVDFNDPGLPRFRILVEIRKCTLGEFPGADGTVCEACSGDTYNFFPTEHGSQCLPCPDNAECNERFIVPKKGQWHKTPCSSHIRQCIAETACSYDNRDEALKRITEILESCNYTAEFVSVYDTTLCTPGYEGPLCGSCAADYGRMRSLQCAKCRGGVSNGFVILVAIGVLFCLSGFSIRSSITRRKSTSRKQRRKRRRRLPRESRRGVATPESQRIPVNLQMVEMLCTGHVPREALQNTPPEDPAIEEATRRRALEFIKWKAAEIFKITVNYLQVIAVAVAINARWTTGVLRLFETAEFLGAMTSEAASRSLDCLIPASAAMPRAALRTVVNIMIPVAVIIAYFAGWAVKAMNDGENAEYLMQRCVLSALSVCYLSYIALTKTAVNVLYCATAEDSIDFLSNSTAKYWAVDTSLKCFEGSHAVLTGFIGWPVLIVFSLGFPVIVAVVFLMEKGRHRMQNEWLFQAAGFLYRAYKLEYVYWESLIMLRKALLTVVVVFAYPLGGNLQGVLSVAVLFLALYFHTICRPFRSELGTALNHFEGLSLLVSSLTFVSGLFFNDDGPSQLARLLLTILIISTNAALFISLACAFYSAGVTYLRAYLVVEGISHAENGRDWHIVGVYMWSQLNEYLSCCFISNEESTVRRASSYEPV